MSRNDYSSWVNKVLVKEDRYWRINVVDKGGIGVIYTDYGKIDGKSIVSKPKIVSKGKFLKSTSATTPYEQALADAASTVLKKVTAEDFKLSKREIARPDYIEEEADFNTIDPMLAKVYTESLVSKWTGYYYQPKYDGGRCILRYDPATKTTKLFTRTKKEYKSLSHISSAFKPNVKEITFFDGEIYGDPNSMTFNENMSIARRDTPDVDSKELFVVIYDVALDIPFKDRLEVIKKIKVGPYVKLAPTTYGTDFSKLPEIKDKIVEEHKCEGIMVRDPMAVYQYGRSSSLLKIKDHMDTEFKVISVNMGNKGTKKEGLIASLTLEHQDRTFNCTFSLPDAENKIWSKKTKSIPGTWFKVKFLGWTYGDENKGVPREPVGLGFRTIKTS